MMRNSPQKQKNRAT